MIQIQDITKKYRTTDVETTALNNLSLSVSEGEFVSIMGSSGCGKSTLLNIIGMLDKPNSGDYVFNGTNVTKLSEADRTNLRKQNIGFIFQNFNLIDELSVFDTLLEENTFNYTQDANGQGVSIKYFETSNGTGLVYTSYGSQDNTASFEIIEVEILDCEPKRCVNVYGTFTATLYNASNSSETIVINNGTFKLKVESFN